MLRPKPPQLRAHHHPVQGLQSRHLAPRGQEQLLHVLPPDAEVPSVDAGDHLEAGGFAALTPPAPFVEMLQARLLVPGGAVVFRHLGFTRCGKRSPF